MSETEDIKTEQTTTPDNQSATTEKETKVVDTTDMPDSSGNKPDDGPSFVQKTMEKLGLRKPSETTESEEEKEGELIPDEFAELATKLGWSKDDIVKFASDYSDEDLLDMIPFLMEEDESREPEKPAKEKETPSHEAESKPEEKNKELEELRKELAEIKEKLGKTDKEREAQEHQAVINNINEIFDKASEEFEVFGKTDKLPVFPAGPKKGQVVPNSPQVKARSAVFEVAVALINAGQPVKEAMDKALTWYKGANLEKDVKRSLIKDLKTSEKKLSAKRTSKETMPSFESEEERQIAFVKQKAAELGIKLNED